ncbi:MFS transporter [Frigidibacter albus]|uniref:MFS transporter n=1 Tax=Frigidibacter albus TaxID=1465486 RepID=A0A6L8VJ54_9RHOB|nr:MFS transporter [Frigidibacter albus]MZQ89821.1 MFS transporter [Frigidibacter albus]NBE31804.1 MFS transporter [Frigidibacter albus]GGH56495.1 MFS transporter [Frigidibacter albus]
MFEVLRNSWALLLGVMLFMLGNGMQGTLLGIRGGIEGFSTLQMSVVMSAYFAGFLFGSRMTPELIRRVGHVRVFAALGSLISAVLVMYAVAPDWIAWTLMRVVIGFSFSGVYITAESWLNNASTNENRGQALSAYMIVQMIGIIAAQGLMAFGDPSGFILFVIPSVLVSLAFTPILLSAGQAPAFESTKPLSFRRLYEASPLGCVGMFLVGGIFAALWGMASVFGTQAGMTVPQISLFIAAIYLGGLVLQYPIGWASDRMDRRKLIVAMTLVAAAVMIVPVLVDVPFSVLLVVAMVAGGVSNPLYSLLVAYTNDFLDNSDMAAASAGLLFINGLGAIGGPLLTGWIMAQMGPSGFFLYIAALMLLLAAYAGYRMTRRPALASDQTGAFAALSPTASSLAVEAALGAAQEGGPQNPDPGGEAEAAAEIAAESGAPEPDLTSDPGFDPERPTGEPERG